MQKYRVEVTALVVFVYEVEAEDEGEAEEAVDTLINQAIEPYGEVGSVEHSEVVEV